MDYDLGYFDLVTRVLEPLENPFGPKVLPMSLVRCWKLRGDDTTPHWNKRLNQSLQ